MTMPHLMNCPHKCESRCLACVKEEWERTDAIINEQAEQIEFLRRLIIDYDVIHCREKKIVEQANHWPTERVELAKRRIAALEGE